jgi:hypothetical protein
MYWRLCDESCRLAARLKAAMQFLCSHLVPDIHQQQLGKKFRALLLA